MAYKSTNFMFRSLNDNEEAEFREWAREHRDEAQEAVKNKAPYHPVVFDEWQRIGAVGGGRKSSKSRFGA